MPLRRRKQYRVAIVGCGKIAGGYDMPHSRSRGKIRTHIKAYRANPRFEVVAACDQSLATVRRFCRHWSIPAAYRDLATMLMCEKPDAVSVCVPTAAHREVLETIARNPVRLVFAEKPFTESARDAKLVLEKLKAKKISVAANYLRRWCPNHRKIKSIIDSGRLGKLRSFDAVYHGSLSNIGSHLIDLVFFLAGEIKAVRAKRGGRGGELFLKGGVSGFLEQSPRDRFVLELLFDHGLVRIARYGYEGECLVWRGKGIRVLQRFSAPTQGIDSAMKHAVANLGEHLARGAALFSDGRGALRVLSVCDALRRSAKSGRTIHCSGRPA